MSLATRQPERGKVMAAKHKVPNAGAEPASEPES